MKKRSFRASTIAKICQVPLTTVDRWLDENRVASFTIPKGNRRVWDTDLVPFLKTQNVSIPASLRSLSNPSVLLVDDDPGVRHLLTRIINQFHTNAVVREAENGTEMRAKVADQPPSLIILDVNLPGTNGLELCAKLRRHPRTKDVNVLVLTGTGTDEEKDQAIKAGADAFLPKPFTNESFAKIVSQLLRRQHGSASEPE